MPAKELMKWIQKEQRWQKYVPGRSPIKRSPNQLQKEFPHLVTSLTKEGTRDAANLWWEQKEQELVEAEQPLTFEQLVKKKNKTREENFRFNELLQDRLSKAAPILEMTGIDADNADALDKHQWAILNGVANLAINNRIVEPQPEVETDRKVTTQVEKWLDHRRREASLKEKNPDEQKYKAFPSMGTVKQNQAHTASLTTFLKECDYPDSIDVINSAWVADFRDHLIDRLDDDGDTLNSGKSALNVLGSVSLFVDWLSIERELITRPNLMAKKGWKKISYDPKPYPMTVETFRTIYKTADDLSKLYLLLMANTGYTAKDISDLKPSEWKQGRIKRKRSKGQGYNNAPVVDRMLWPETQRLLKEFGSRKGERVLTTETGAALVTSNRKDSIGERLRGVIKQAGFKGGRHYRPKDIRSGCATLIDSNKAYDGWETYFLGHSPQGTADVHYVGQNGDKQDSFDELTMWLRKKWLDV